MAQQRYRRLTSHTPLFWLLIALNVMAVAAGMAAAFYMETNGHGVTGMNNQIVWGLPHVFAVFLIVSASGALNVASVSSVFNRLNYKPFARLSGALAIALLVGGLAVLVLDLGRPERVFVAMTTYNFRSIFAWNIYLYSGFVVIVVFYLFAMMDRRASRNHVLGKALGSLAFVWRLVLTMGTGSIFGFLVARDAFFGAIMAPLFIATSLAYGLAFTVLVLATMSHETSAELMPEEMVGKFRGLLSLFILTTLFLTLIAHLAKIYAAPSRGVEAFLLLDGGVFPLAFWMGQVVLGSLAPLALLALAGNGASGRKLLALASVLILLGGLAQFYVIIIGGQAYPLNIFPGYAASSAFFDGAIISYAPSAPEILLGISGISLAMLIAALAFRLLPFLPQAPASTRSAPASTGSAPAKSGGAAS